MSNQQAILVDNVTKRYQLGETRHTMLREAVVGALARLTGKARAEEEGRILWALNGVSLEVQRGEVLGLVGRNGAGKSTLLKILSRITYPTSGQISVHGRVGSLLEVGTGFHDELSGRENIYLNGSILGMKRHEIDREIDRIVDFADISEFLDTPIKRYSSGMRMRLGFAIAAHLSTDVLFVDEVLAVGDAGFQKKCLSSMRELGQGGRTVIFVSHNLSAIENLCSRTIWLSDGQIKEDGQTKDVLKSYLASFGAGTADMMDLTSIAERRGSGLAKLTTLQVIPPDGDKIVHSGDSLTIRLSYECQKDLANVHFGVRIHSNLGLMITEANTWATGQALPFAPAGPGQIEVQIDNLNLMPGTYYLGAWVATYNEWQDLVEHAAKLDIEASDFYGTGRGVEARFGVIFLPYRWVPRSASS
jgi:lipopolysaccharide transport system ATP-binding protein